MYTFFERLLHPYPTTASQPASPHFMSFIWGCTKGIRHYFFILIFVVAGLSAFEAALYAFIGKIVDWLSNVPPSELWTRESHTLILLVAVLAGSCVLVALETLFRRQVLAVNFPMLLRWNFHRQMLSQSMSFFQDEFAGRISAKVMQTALAVRDVYMVTCDMVIFVIIYFFSMTLIIGAFDPLILIPFALWVTTYAGMLYYFVPRLGKVSRNQADARSLMTGRITDAYTNIATVKLFSHAGREAAYAREAMQQFIKTGYAQMRMISSFEILNHTASILLIMGTSGTALLLWSQDKVGIGGVAAAMAMCLRLNSIAHRAMWEMTALFEGIGVVQDGINTLSRGQTVRDKPDATNLVVTQGEVRFDHVRFSYGKPLAILDDFTLTIRPGEKIGLVGRSGAGKSTIVNLLLRFYDVDNGTIRIDEQDIAQVKQDSLRENIGMVTQDTSLLHRSVRENIAYGKPDASDEEIIAAARRAEAHEFILTLEDAKGRTGYDAYVGERGVKLSGGQRQRIAIARVMLKDAPILLLDEATSALDSEAEIAIQESLNNLMQDKTVIAIAHRLSTIAAMDRLIILDKGRIVEQGSHKELLQKEGLYARLWKHQSGGFLGDS